MGTLTLKEPELVTQLEALAKEQTVSADTLLIEAVNEYLQVAQRRTSPEVFTEPTVPAAFLAEMAAFERMKPELLKTYPGRVVAVLDGEVVLVGDDILEVHEQVIERFGNVPCYVDKVTDELPRPARIVSTSVLGSKNYNGWGQQRILG